MERETELEMVRRHIREGEGHLTRQAALITRLRERGVPTDMAIALLEQFTDYQRQHVAHLTRLQPGIPRAPSASSQMATVVSTSPVPTANSPTGHSARPPPALRSGDEEDGDVPEGSRERRQLET